MLVGTRSTLVYVLKNIMLLLHPVMPFITEEIWQRIASLTGNTESIMLQAYPVENKALIDADATQTLEWLKSIIIAIRTIRSEMNIAPGKLLPLVLRGKAAEKILRNDSESNPIALLKSIARIESIDWINESESPPPSATAVVGELEIFIPLSGFINPAEESARLQKEIAKIEKDLALITGKLQNPQFVDRAPADVVEKEKARLLELTSTLQKLTAQLTAVMPM